MNIFRFVTNRTSARVRGDSTWPAHEPAKSKKPISVIRAMHSANANPEPLAIEAFSRRMGAQKIAVRILKPRDLSQLPGCGAALAFMTGTGELKLTDKQRAGLKGFVRKGGTVLIDAAGGCAEFYKSARLELETVFGKGKVAALEAKHRLLNLGGFEISNVRDRDRASDPHKVRLGVVNYCRRPAVLISAADLTAGLVGYRMHGIRGLAPGDAFAVCRNAALYAAGTRK
jgi:hypothetical protein